MAKLSRTYASLDILQEEPKPLITPPTLTLRESYPLSATQAVYPGKQLKPSKSKLESSLFRKTLASYLKKTKQGRDFLCRIREQRAIPQVSNFFTTI